MEMNKLSKLLLLPLLFALVACGNDDDSGSDTSSGGSSPSSTDTSGTEIPNDPHWVHFDTHCAAALEAVFTAKISTMPIVENGTLILEGWFLEATYANIVSFPYIVTADVTLHAKWTDGNVADFTYSTNLSNTGYIVTSYGGNSTNVVIPSYYNSRPVLELGEYIFSENGSIASVTLPSMLTKIGMGAFKDAIQLSSIVIPSNVTLIDTDAFADCLALQTVAMPSKLEVVGNNAFEGTAIAAITLNNHVAEINSRAFADCANLRDVYLDNLTPPIRGASSFENTNNLLRYKVYESALDAYKTSAYWSSYASQIIVR
ncbi:MAG: leucine-rich repeat domain-containing protein [Bacilli bacterium]